jgi:integrase
MAPVMPDLSTREPAPPVTRKILPGFGAIYVRGKTWYVDYWHDNRQYRESSHSTKERVAIKLLRQRCDELARDEFIKPKINKVTMKDLFDAVVADYEKRDNRSSDTLGYRLKPLRKFFDHMRASTVTERDLERYKSQRLAGGKTKATINRELAVIRRAYKLATRGKEKLVSPNSVPAVELYPENNAREGFIEYADFLELVRHLPIDIADVCWFAYLMGWRKEQVLSLRWADINRDSGTVIRRAEFNKTKEPSVLAMSESVRAVIERRWSNRTVTTKMGPRVCDLVFHRQGQPIRDFRGSWEKACISAGLCVTVKDSEGQETKRASLMFHDFRRSCVRNLENAGTPRKVAKSITGHITDSVYERYHVVKEEDQRAALARVEAGFIANQHKTAENQHNGHRERVPVPAIESI